MINELAQASILTSVLIKVPKVHVVVRKDNEDTLVSRTLINIVIPNHYTVAH